MATLERIRQRSGLLIIVIGLAMAAFILTDLFSSGNSMLRNDANIVGEVNGSSIDYLEFNSRMEERIALLQQQNPQQAQNFSRIMVADQIWREYQQEVLLGASYEELGLAIGDRELFERITKNPQVRSQEGFKDPITGQFSEAAFKQYLTSLQDNVASDPQAANAFKQWLSFEDGTRQEALQNKYLYAVRKGLYMPSRLAKADYTRRNETALLQYVGKEYSTIADSTVAYEESDLRAYYKNHKEDFKSDETRDLAFVSFRVEASASDRAALKAELASYLVPQVIKSRFYTDTVLGFGAVEEDSAFAVGRSDFPVTAQYYTESEISFPLDSTLFEKEVGHVEGPYEQNGNFVLTKISDIINKPDSVKARHILISFQGAGQGRSNATRAPQEAKNLADSLLAVVQEDSTKFGALAIEYSDDPGSGAKGGNLGFFAPGAMVPSFNDFCFYNEEGTIGMVFSQFGFHIIHIQEQEGSNKALKLINIRRAIEASDRTRDSIYNIASNFAAAAQDTADFAAFASASGFSARPATKIEAFQESILGIGNNREIVRWLFNEETELGAIQLFNQDNNSFIVVQLTELRPEGYLPFELVEEDIIPLVIKEKKGEILKAELAKAVEGQDNPDLNAVAQSLSVQMKTQSVNFATANLTGFGSEPKVIGAASTLAKGAFAGPIVGDRGVYLIKVNTRTEAEELPSWESEQIRLETNMVNLVNSQVFESIKASAEIEDNRARFF